MPPKIKRVLVTGGAGYIGSALVPKLLSSGYEVNVLDLFLYGKAEKIFASCYPPPRLRLVHADIRTQAAVRHALEGCQAVIHLACMSNDPTFDQFRDMSEKDFPAFEPLIQASKDAGVRRFIYASSSSVYGTKPDDVEVTEDLPLEPLTAYSKCKAMCEDALRKAAAPGFVTTILRPATVCGYAPRLRLDVVVNLFTAQAKYDGRIRLEGGNQMRASLHIEDMTDLYVQLLELPDEAIEGKTWNVNYCNLALKDVAGLIQTKVPCTIESLPVADQRSYRICSSRITYDIGFMAIHSVEQAIDSLIEAFDNGLVPHAMTDDRYYNIKRMRRLMRESTLVA